MLPIRIKIRQMIPTNKNKFVGDKVPDYTRIKVDKGPSDLFSWQTVKTTHHPLNFTLCYDNKIKLFEASGKLRNFENIALFI